jgi:hypothetical protein
VPVPEVLSRPPSFLKEKEKSPGRKEDMIDVMLPSQRGNLTEVSEQSWNM